MRTFVIINDKNLYDYNERILSKLHSDEKVYVFSKSNDIEDAKSKFPSVEHVMIPDEASGTEPKIRNFISKYFKDNNTSGFLHVLTRSVLINKDPYEFFAAIEEMMLKIKNDVWFNCSCDPVNYVFSKFNSRYDLEIDDDEAIKTYKKTLHLCSNANTEWIIYNLDTITYDRMEFDENFTVAMYFIIKYLAERRNNKKSGEFYYMNMYPTVPEEFGVFSDSLESNDKPDKSDNEMTEIMTKEDEIFKNMKINYTPDHDIVQISEDLRNILVS